MLQKQTAKKGFTIIEVVLVLAIAGLIFLMVFIAVPALQRNQRNTDRRQFYGRLGTSITNWKSNNNGKAIPTGNSTIMDAIIKGTGDLSADPTAGNSVTLGGVATAYRNFQVGSLSYNVSLRNYTGGGSQTVAMTDGRAQVIIIQNAMCTGTNRSITGNSIGLGAAEAGRTIVVGALEVSGTGADLYCIQAD